MKKLIGITLVLLLCTGSAFAQTGAIGQATATSEQTQGQAQTQGNANSLANIGNSAVVLENSFNGAEPIRYLPVPTSVPMENYQGQMFSNPNYADHGPNFVSMNQVVDALNAVDLNAVDQDLVDKVRIVPQMLGRAGKQMKRSERVRFELAGNKETMANFMPIAMFNLRVKKPDKINSVGLAIAIALKARELGARRIVLLTEGSSKELSSWGIGLGFSYNYASVGSKPSDAGAVGAGGTGWSMGKGKYDSLIYLSAMVGN